MEITSRCIFRTIEQGKAMVTTFNQIKLKPIAFCIVDTRHTYTSGWATEVSMNISDFLIHRITIQGYDVFIGRNEDALLKHVSEEFYTHAVVIAMGMSLGLNDRLFPAIENLCKKDFFVSGHILERTETSYWGDAYYELHHQFYVVHLKKYIELDYPEIGQPEDTPHLQYAPLRSKTCLYNDPEVAEWIKPGVTPKKYQRKLHGWNIISTALKFNRPLIDLGQDIRDTKKYLYYEYDHVFLRTMPEIYYNQFFCNNFFASWNSDSFKETMDFIGPVEQYITVGIGLYWVSNLSKVGFTKDTRVVFTDINYNTLQFMKALVEEWDGIDYATFYKNHMPQLPSGFSGDVDAYIEYTRKEFLDFVGKFPNWLELWNQVKQLKFEYVLIDYMAKHDLSWIEPGKNTIMNISDVFTHSPYIATQSLKYRVSCENKLIKELQEIDTELNLLMTSRSADGFHSEPYRTLFGPVKKFDLTDMDDLTRPPWHGSDWDTLRILG